MLKPKLFSILFVLFVFPLWSQTWQACSNPPGGSIFTMVSIGNILFTGSNNGGIYYSSDLGVTWNQSNGGLPNHVISLCTDGTNLYAGTTGFSYTAIYKSSDLAQSWTNITPAGLYNFSDVSALITDGTYLFAGISGASTGVYKSLLSNLSSSSWTLFSNGIQNSFVRSLSVCASTIFASTYILNDPSNGIYQSPTNTDQWVISSNGLTPTSNYIKTMAIRGNTVFAGSIYGTQPSIYCSNNGGSTWAVSSTVVFTNNPMVYALLFNGNDIYAGTELGGIYRSADNGVSWQSYSSGLNGSGSCGLNIRSLARIGTTLFAGTDCGVWRTTICNSIPPNPVNTSASNASTVCSMQSATLSANSAGTIQWYTLANNGAAMATGSVLITAPLTINTTFYAEAFTCAPSASRTAISVQVEPLPQIVTSAGNSLSCSGAQVGISMMGAVSSTWQPGNLVGTAVFVNPTSSTVYTVTGTGANGCIATATLAHSVSECTKTNVQLETETPGLRLFPNPCYREVFILNPGNECLFAKVFSSNGAEISIHKIEGNSVSAISDLIPGLYTVVIQQNSFIIRQKIVVLD